jgi:undecaprenyl-diphosphatase
MYLWESIILGIIEGLTEFLPVSSTFHLIAAGRLLGVEGGEFAKLFDVVIQSGAILAVLILYWKRLRTDAGLVKKTVVAFLPTAALAIPAYGTIKDVFFESYAWMMAIFVFVGLLFFGFEGLVKKGVLRPDRLLTDLTYRNAALVGLAQCLAFFPGVSRAGAVILAMMVLGYRRDEAAAFSFLLAVPTILAAGAYDLYKTRDLLLSSGSSAFILLIGFATAFAVAYLAVKWLIRYLQRHSLHLFGFYRVVAGGILFLLFSLGL